MLTSLCFTVLSPLRGVDQHVGEDSSEVSNPVDTFAPFVEFDLLNRDDKRALLNTITPSITVSDYHVQGIYIGLEVNHTGAASEAIL